MRRSGKPKGATLTAFNSKNKSFNRNLQLDYTLINFWSLKQSWTLTTNFFTTKAANMPLRVTPFTNSTMHVVCHNTGTYVHTFKIPYQSFLKVIILTSASHQYKHLEKASGTILYSLTTRKINCKHVHEKLKLKHSIEAFNKVMYNEQQMVSNRIP